MPDFIFASPEIQMIHKKWLTEELAIDAQARGIKAPSVKKIESMSNVNLHIVHTTLGFPGQIPSTKTFGVRKKLPSGKILPAAIIVESLDETNYKSLKPKYSLPERNPGEMGINNLVIFRWRLEENTVCCALEYYAYRPSIVSLEILPSYGGAFIELPRKSFVRNAGDAELIRLNVSALRNEIRELVETYCKPQGYKPAGVEDEITRHEPKVPSTKEEFKTALGNLSNILGLDELYGEQELAKFAEKVARNIEGALTDFGLPQSATMALTKVNLFRTIIFCDDSGSMSGALYKRVQKDAVMRLGPLATRLNENGVSLRFINFKGDGSWDNIKTSGCNELEAKYDRVSPGGGTPIGASLDRKVVQPLVSALDIAESIRPTLVSIITDGEASDKDLFEATIRRCKQALVDKNMLNKRTLGHASVIFQIHFIGSDPGASSFIDRLDANLGEFIFCNKKRLDKYVVDPNFSEAQRYRLMLDVSSAAIDRVVAMRLAHTTP